MRLRGRVDGEVLNEVKNLYSRRHRFILPLLSSFVVAGDSSEAIISMVTPYAQGGDMYGWIGTAKPSELPSYPPSMDDDVKRRDFILRSMASLSEALAYLHSKIGDRWCGHFDIKPHNILLFQEGAAWVWKLSDFGLSNLRSLDDEGTTEEIGTDEYQPPEYHKSPAETKYGPSFDVWSLGCVFLELLMVLVYNWTTNQTREMKKTLSRNSNFLFRSPPNISQWASHLRRGTHESRITRTLKIVLKMLTVEVESRLYAFDAAIDLMELTYPDMTVEYYLEKCQEIMRGQGPSPSFGRFYDPVIRIRRDAKYRRQSFVNSRIQCLYEAGWPHRPSLPQHASPKFPQTKGDSLTTLPSHYHEKDFYGREEMLETIESSFVYTRHVALVGLGGVGKSHLAHEYASKARASALAAGRSLHTFWVRCRNASAFTDSYVDIAKVGGLALERGSERKILRAVIEWLLNLDESWIMVLDGVEDANAMWLTDWCPFEQGTVPMGRILVTTKSMQVGQDLCYQPDNVLPIAIDSLKIEDGVKLLLQGTGSIGRYDTREAEKLVRNLHLPILIKLISQEIRRRGQGGQTISDFANRLLSRQELIAELCRIDARDPKLSELKAVKRIYTIVFGSLFETKVALRNIFKMVCFFANDSIDRSWMESEFGKEDAQEAFIFFADRQYIRFSDSPDGSRYATHTLVQSMFQAWMSDRSEDAKRDFWSAHRRALWMIYHDYREGKKRLTIITDKKRKSEKRQTPAHLVKLRYKDHIEEFLKYVDHHDISSLKFNKTAADAVITFARWFDDENRMEVGQRLLRLVIDQGIENDVGRRSELQARRDLVQSLTTNAAGRAKQEMLCSAESEITFAIRAALEIGDAIIIWKTRREYIYLLCRMDSHQAATVELQKLESLFTEISKIQREAHHLQQDLTQCRAKCFFIQGVADKDTAALEESRLHWHDCITQLELSATVDTEVAKLLQRARKGLAEACLAEIECLDAFIDADEHIQIHGKQLGDEAWDIYNGILQARQSRYIAEAREFESHKHVIDACRDFNLAQLRIWLWRADSPLKQMIGIESAIEPLQKVLDDYHTIIKLGVRDEDVRITAYYLRDGLSFVHNKDGTARYDVELSTLQHKYDLKRIHQSNLQSPASSNMMLTNQSAHFHKLTSNIRPRRSILNLSQSPLRHPLNNSPRETCFQGTACRYW